VKPELENPFANSESNSFKRLNPHLFGAVGAVEAKKPEPTTAKTLERRDQKLKRGKVGVQVRVHLVAVLRRELDDDNLVASFKCLRDHIASELGIDDADKRVEWKYHQLHTSGEEGVLVMLETISPAVARNNRPYIRKTDSALATEGQAAGENNNP
jgi:hypothetical protein